MRPGLLLAFLAAVALASAPVEVADRYTMDQRIA
ncbi:hypothetical protein LCGC14_2747340, partial [marine sediment metagenome]